MRHCTPRTLIRLSAIVVAALIVHACTPMTEIEQTWTSPTAMQRPPLEQVVTIFFANNQTMRRAGEDQMARDLAAQGVRATPAYAILTEDETRNLDTVKQKLRARGYDGVVTMRVVDRYQELEYAPSTFTGYWGYASPYFYSPGFYSPGYAYTETVVRVETNAYSLRTDQLVWSALTRTVDGDSGDVIDDTSEVIARQLTQRGLAG